MEVLKDFFYKFIQSCTNFGFFKNVVSQPLMMSFKFFLALILIISVIVGIRQGWLISNFLEDILIWASSALPDIVIKDGILNVQVEQPYRTTYKNIPILIDTTGELQNLKEYQMGVLIQKDRVLYKRPQVGTTIFKLDRIRSLKLTPDSINQMKKNLYPKIIPVTILFMYIYFGIVKFIHIFLFSLLGMAVNNFKHKGFSFKEILNISVYAFSPVALISIILGILGIHATISWLVYSGVYAFYIVGAIFYTPSKTTTLQG